MSTGQIVTSNGWVSARATDAQGLLNIAGVLHLYQNPINPDPSTPLATFVAAECNFDTYSPINLAGGWNPPVTLGLGHWTTTNGPVTFLGPTSTGNTIYGLWVDDGSGNLLFSYELVTPISFPVGSPSLNVSLSFEDWARSVLP